MAASHKALKIVGVAGAGLMGRGIAQVAAQAGFDVRLIDLKPFAAADAKRLIGEQLSTLASKGKISAAAAKSAVAHIAVPDSIAAFSGADLVIEAIVEQLEAKRTLIASLDAVVGRECILATNTSSLSVTAIASASAHPARVAGLHFFSPVPMMKVVEVISGLLTSPAVIGRLAEFASALGHTPVKARDTPGFIVNHAGRGYGTEALRIVGEGIAAPATVDRILKLEAGFRMGPFELLDLTGLDVSHPVMESIYHQYYEEPRFRPSPLTAQRLAAGLLGRKSGRGFYDYRGVDALAQPRAGAPAATVATEVVGDRPRPRRVWVSAKDAGARQRVVGLLRNLAAELDDAASPHADSLCVVLPSGADATSAALEEHLDPKRTVALDAMFDLSRHRTLMTTSVTERQWRDVAETTFAMDGIPVDVIHDSPGFIVPRTLAHIVNIACDIAQQRIATPEDIDLAVRIGLAYPSGPLAWGDAIGPVRLLRVLEDLVRSYGDPRYRPSLWLSRRARLGVSLLTPEA
jgi:3-hydroxybutyryl-CoA dehydrogenase